MDNSDNNQLILIEQYGYCYPYGANPHQIETNGKSALRYLLDVIQANADNKAKLQCTTCFHTMNPIAKQEMENILKYYFN